MPTWRNDRPRKAADGVLLDLGVSSPQLDVPERGSGVFSAVTASLDMRHGPAAMELTAEIILNWWGADELADIFWNFVAVKRNLRKIACAIVLDTETKRPSFAQAQLAELMEKELPRAVGKKRIRRRRFFRRCAWRSMMSLPR